MSKEQWQGSLLIVCTVLGVLIAASLWLNHKATDSDLVKSAQIIQGYAASLILLAGGAFAAIRFELFRTFVPHVTISQIVSHRTISASYVHLMVTTTLHNSSKVKVDFQECYFQLQQLAPAPDAEVEHLYAQLFAGGDSDRLGDFQWNTLDKKRRIWRRNELTIEPGGSRQETCEFIVTSEVLSVLVYAYFYNSRRPYIPEGWGVTTAYDIMQTTSITD